MPSLQEWVVVSLGLWIRFICHCIVSFKILMASFASVIGWRYHPSISHSLQIGDLIRLSGTRKRLRCSSIRNRSKFAYISCNHPPSNNFRLITLDSKILASCDRTAVIQWHTVPDLFFDKNQCDDVIQQVWLSTRTWRYTMQHVAALCASPWLFLLAYLVVSPKGTFILFYLYLNWTYHSKCSQLIPSVQQSWCKCL